MGHELPLTEALRPPSEEVLLVRYGEKSTRILSSLD